MRSVGLCKLKGEKCSLLMPEAQKDDLGEFVTDVLLPSVNNDGPIFVPETLLLVRRYLITDVSFCASLRVDFSKASLVRSVR